MKTLSEAYNEGYESCVANLSLKENPYHTGTIEHGNWETGWWIAKTSRATNVPVDFDPENVFDEANRMVEEVIDQMNDPFMEKYQEWVSKLDPRVAELVVALGIFHPDSADGTREKFIGELEVLLFLCAKNGEDFIKMYAQVCLVDHNNPGFRRNATMIWNIAGAVAAFYRGQSKNPHTPS